MDTVRLAGDEVNPARGATLISEADSRPEGEPRFSRRTLLAILASGALYYLSTQLAWVLCFPDSKVSLIFPPHAVLVSILLLVPLRHWWAYALAAICGHFIASQQAQWPPLYALQCEAFDVTKAALTAGGIRWLLTSPFDRITLREAILFMMVAVFIVPFGTAFWGARFTIANHFGTDYWVEWRNLGISNGVTSIVLVPAILLGARMVVARGKRVDPARILEAVALVLALVAVGTYAFDRVPSGPNTSPALLYAPVPLLVWATLRFGLGGMSGSMLLITVLAIRGTMNGHGPFLEQSPAENVLALQLFVLVAAAPLMLLAVAIEDERRSKEALRLSEERMSLAAESAQLVLWDWDMARDTVWISEEGRNFFGFEPGLVIDHATLAGRVHPDDRAARSSAIEAALATGGTYEAEFRLTLADGSVRWVAARGGSPMPAEGDAPMRMRGVAIDITQQKQARAEAQLQREELAHLSRVASLSLLSGSLAHELSQPLASILMNARAGQRFMSRSPLDVDEIREILADIVSEDRRAGEIIDRLRTMLRRGEVSLLPVDVSACIDELLHLIRSDLLARGVTVANLATADLPAVMTDRVQLQQVLLNLIMNACDAMAGNPPEERQLTLATLVAGNDLHIAVLDRGIGLPDDVETLFQPFHTTKPDGLGMGLSICRTLVIAQGGRLWAERREGGGAAFHVALPLAPADA